MKFTNKVIKSIVACAASLIIAAGSAICASAVPGFAVDGYGTYEDGIKPPIPFYTYYHACIPGDGFPNFDFNKGFEYWTMRYTNTDTIRKIRDIAQIKKDSDGNTYAHIDAPRDYAGIVTPKFKLEKLAVGSTPGILYKWRGEQPHLQVYLEEYFNADNKEEGGSTLRVGHNGDRGAQEIWAADEENPEEWNIRLSINNKPVVASTSENPTRYYSVGVEVTKEGASMDVDDIQVVIHNDETKKVYDLDGKLLYDLTNLPKRESPDYDFGELSDTVDTTEDVSKASGEGNKKNPDAPKNSTGKTLYWVIIGAAVVIVAAAAVVTVIVVKKKKAKAVPPADGGEVKPSDTTEEKTEEKEE